MPHIVHHLVSGISRLLLGPAEAGRRGASLVEYALLLALIAVVVFAAIEFLGGETTARLDGVGSSIAGP